MSISIGNIYSSVQLTNQFPIQTAQSEGIFFCFLKIWAIVILGQYREKVGVGNSSGAPSEGHFLGQFIDFFAYLDQTVYRCALDIEFYTKKKSSSSLLFRTKKILDEAHFGILSSLDTDEEVHGTIFMTFQKSNEGIMLVISLKASSSNNQFTYASYICIMNTVVVKAKTEQRNSWSFF